jgi:hypothetical protein
MDYQIRSLLLTGSGSDVFSCVDTFRGKIPDKNYIKGAIEWNVGGVTILDDSHWDIVDLLWLFILDGIVKLGQTEAVEVLFPSQPLQLRFSKIGSNQIQIKLDDFTTVVDRALAIRSLCEGGRVFFDRMGELLPQLRTKWNSGLQKIEEIKRIFPFVGEVSREEGSRLTDG